MTGFWLGPIRLASCWQPLLHPKVRSLRFSPLPDVVCDDCRMVASGFFEPSIKCCDYVPPIPNFLAGEILTDGQLGGSRETVRQWTGAGRADPLFLNVPPRLIALHRTKRLPCPLLDEAVGCTIYDHRPYLCVGYNCTFPPNPHVKAFWNCLSSLLALHSAITAQFLVGALGLDRLRYTEAWERAGAEATVWTDQDAIEPSLIAELWQGESDPERFYRRCYQHIVDHAESIREQVDGYRREQLIRRLGELAALTPEREQEIVSQSLDPIPRQPPGDADTAFSSRLVVFAEHRWTLVEHESYLLWYHGLLSETVAAAAKKSS